MLKGDLIYLTDTDNTEVQADILEENGKTTLIFEGEVSLSLLLVCILRGFEIRRVDVLQEDYYQAYGKSLPDGDGEGGGSCSFMSLNSGKGSSVGRGNLGSGEGVLISGKLGDGEGEGSSSLPGVDFKRVKRYLEEITLISVDFVSNPIHNHSIPRARNYPA